MKGDCPGHDINRLAVSLEDCEKQCDSKASCTGYLYIVQIGVGKTYPHPPCILKNKMCDTPSLVPGLDISAYFKTMSNSKWKIFNAK